MPRWHRIDEFHVALFVPSGRTPSGVRAALADPRLLARLRAAARQTLSTAPGLYPVRVTVSRCSVVRRLGKGV
jgi:hypothetical protein